MSSVTAKHLCCSHHPSSWRAPDTFGRHHVRLFQAVRQHAARLLASQAGPGLDFPATYLPDDGYHLSALSLMVQAKLLKPHTGLSKADSIAGCPTCPPCSALPLTEHTRGLSSCACTHRSTQPSVSESDCPTCLPSAE